jgi:tetratricopeptide (TPR) repeat protein
MVIKHLIDLDQIDMALTELDALPLDQYDSKMWQLRGTVLHMANRLGEALPCLDRSLEGSVEPGDRQLNLALKAHTLRRLGRFKEAIQIFEGLLGVVSEAKLPALVMTMGWCYLGMNQPENAARLLEPLALRHPDFGHGWATLGRAYQIGFDHERAVECFRRSLRLNPREIDCWVFLAGVLMDQRGAIEEALQCLEVAFRQACDAEELHVRRLACYLLLNRQADADQLFAEWRNALGDTHSLSMLQQARELASRIADARNGGELPRASRRLEPPEVSDADIRAVTDAVDAFLKIRTRGREAEGRFKPVLTVRFERGPSFSVDYYDDPGEADYVESFSELWRFVIRLSTYRLGGWPSTSTPFYFAQCRSCTMLILSNRDLEDLLQCRMCKKTYRTHRIQRSDLEAVLTSIHQAIKPIEKP